MSKITLECNGCKWLTECLAPQCKNCVDHDNYELRTHNFGVEKEMGMLGVTPPRRIYATVSPRSYTDGLLKKMINTMKYLRNGCLKKKLIISKKEKKRTKGFK